MAGFLILAMGGIVFNRVAAVLAGRPPDETLRHDLVLIAMIVIRGVDRDPARPLGLRHRDRRRLRRDLPAAEPRNAALHRDDHREPVHGRGGPGPRAKGRLSPHPF